MRCISAGVGTCLFVSLLSLAAAQDGPPGKFITLEVVVAEVPAGAAATPTAAAILELEKAGKLSGLARFRLSGLENQQAMIQFGEMTPIVSSRANRGGGQVGPFGASTSYTQVSVGTVVTTVSRVESDSAVVTDLKIQRSSVTPPHPAEAAEGNPPPQGTVTLNVQTTVRTKPGEPLLVTGRQLGSGKDATQTWVVLTSTVAAGAAADKPADKKAAAADPLDGEQLKIVHLKHAAAASLANVLTGVFQREPVRIAVDERTNSLLLRGSAARLEVILALIVRLDEA